MYMKVNVYGSSHGDYTEWRLGDTDRNGVGDASVVAWKFIA
jgi:hypothetical protein